MELKNIKIIDDETFDKDFQVFEPELEPEPFIIPGVYYYDPLTKEYLYQQTADKDPVMSEIKGCFVPMVHANSTLVVPPECRDNEVAVYSKEIILEPETYEEDIFDEETGEIIGTETKTREVKRIVESWEAKADYRKNFLKVDKTLNVSPITTIGEQVGFIVVEKELAEQIKQNPSYFKILDEKIVKKTDEEYEIEQAQKEKERINSLTMTKRVLWLQLKELGITYSQLTDLINSNVDAKAEWELCERLERSNPLLDIMGAQLGITPNQIDEMFKKANGEEIYA